MQLLGTALTALGSVLVLFILTKLMGNRQMSQLSMFDYINGITIGSIAAEMATSLESDFLKPLLAMLVYAALSILISFLNNKSIRLRRILGGESLILLQEGKLYEKNLKKAHLDLSEFLLQCRNAGYFNLAELQTAVLESNGKISFLPLSYKRPVNPSDLKLIPTAEKPLINLILDGKIMTEHLKRSGKNEQWLRNQMHAQGVTQVSEVFLATCDCENVLTIYRK